MGFSTSTSTSNPKEEKNVFINPTFLSSGIDSIFKILWIERTNSLLHFMAKNRAELLQRNPDNLEKMYIYSIYNEQRW